MPANMTWIPITSRQNWYVISSVLFVSVEGERRGVGTYF